MKRLLAYLFIVLGLGLVANVKADDIRDFQIEGMSIGDSALDYMNEKEFNQSKLLDDFKDKKYSAREFKNFGFMKVYKTLHINYLTNDKKYIIQGISGIVNFKYSINKCHKQKDIIKDELKSLFPNAKLQKGKKKFANTLGKGHWEGYAYILNSGDLAIITCYDYSSGYEDHLRISIRNKKYNDWLLNEAYN